MSWDPCATELDILKTSKNLMCKAMEGQGNMNHSSRKGVVRPECIDTCINCIQLGLLERMTHRLERMKNDSASHKNTGLDGRRTKSEAMVLAKL